MARCLGSAPLPRPTDPLAVAAFRVGLEERLGKPVALFKNKPVKIWVADESRFGLHTQEPPLLDIARTTGGHPAATTLSEWEYVYGAVERAQGGAEFRFMRLGEVWTLAAVFSSRLPPVIRGPNMWSSGASGRISSPPQSGHVAGAHPSLHPCRPQPGTQPGGGDYGIKCRTALATDATRTWTN